MVFSLIASNTALAGRLWHISMMRNADCTLERTRGVQTRPDKHKRAIQNLCVGAALLVAVWVVQQVGHREEGVVEDTGGNGPVLGVDQQHAPQ